MQQIENKEITQTEDSIIENDKNSDETEDKDGNGKVSYLALGLCFGCAFGVIFKNIPIGVSVGIIIGVIMDGRKNRNYF